jgi:hypothetical protein
MSVPTNTPLFYFFNISEEFSFTVLHWSEEVEKSGIVSPKQRADTFREISPGIVL